MFSHFFLSLSVRLILRACTSLSRYAVLLQFPLCDILNSISITFSFSFCLFPVTVFPIYNKASAASILLKFRLFHEFFGGRRPRNMESIPLSVTFYKIQTFFMSFQFFAFCKCRSCSISIVILVCTIRNRLEFYLLCHKLLFLCLYVPFFWIQSTHTFSKIAGVYSVTFLLETQLLCLYFSCQTIRYWFLGTNTCSLGTLLWSLDCHLSWIRMFNCKNKIV